MVAPSWRSRFHHCYSQDTAGKIISRKQSFVATSVVLASLLLGACSSSEGDSDATASGGAGNTGGNGTGGTRASSTTSTGNRAGAGGQVAAAGGSAGTGATSSVSLHIKWSTYQADGSTLSPVTCAGVGANTVGFKFSGSGASYTGGTYFSTNGSECASGNDEDFDWEAGPGNFTLYIGIWVDGYLTDGASLMGTSVDFTVPKGVSHVDVPEVKIIFAAYSLVWEIQSAGAAATCDAVGAVNVRFEAVEKIGEYSRTSRWQEACNHTSNRRSPPLGAGTYTLSATLLTGSDEVLASWTDPSPLEVSDAGASTIPTIKFEIP